MPLRIRQSFTILAPGSSLRRRVAYSLLVVRLILVLVIFLADCGSHRQCRRTRENSVGTSVGRDVEAQLPRRSLESYPVTEVRPSV